jgi:hypothetical protein
MPPLRETNRARVLAPVFPQGSHTDHPLSRKLPFCTKFNAGGRSLGSAVEPPQPIRLARPPPLPTLGIDSRISFVLADGYGVCMEES